MPDDRRQFRAKPLHRPPERPLRFDRPRWQTENPRYRHQQHRLDEPRQIRRPKGRGREGKRTANLIVCPSIVVLIERRDLLVNFLREFEVSIYVAIARIIGVLADREVLLSHPFEDALALRWIVVSR